MDPWAKKWIGGLKTETEIRLKETCRNDRDERKRQHVDRVCQQWVELIDKLDDWFTEIQAMSLSREKKEEVFLSRFVMMPSRPNVAISLRVITKVDAIRGIQLRTHVAHDNYFTFTLYVCNSEFDTENNIVAAAASFVARVKAVCNKFT